MADLDIEIAELKATIKRYEDKLNTATSDKQLDIFASLIISTRDTLHRLLDEK
eukprot:gene12146-13811_t